MGFVSNFVKSNLPRSKTAKVTNIVQETPQAPTIDQAAQNAEDQNRLMRRRGRRAYVKTPQQGLGQPAVGTKTLVGS